MGTGVYGIRKSINMKIVLLLVALPCIWAQTAAPDGSVKPCCTPEKMEGMVYNMQTGQNLLFSVDHAQAKRIVRDANNPTTGWTLEDFNAKMTYVHDGANCVSYKATYIGSGSFGPVGAQPYDASSSLYLASTRQS